MFNNFFFLKIWDKVEKYGGARGASNYVTIWRKRVACWQSKHTCSHTHAHTHTHTRPHARARTYTNIYNSLLFRGNIGYANAPQSYVICTLSVLLVWLRLPDDGGVLEFVVFYIQYIWPLKMERTESSETPSSSANLSHTPWQNRKSKKCHK